MRRLLRRPRSGADGGGGGGGGGARRGGASGGEGGRQAADAGARGGGGGGGGEGGGEVVDGGAAQGHREAARAELELDKYAEAFAAAGYDDAKLKEVAEEVDDDRSEGGAGAAAVDAMIAAVGVKGGSAVKLKRRMMAPPGKGGGRGGGGGGGGAAEAAAAAAAAAGRAARKGGGRGGSRPASAAPAGKESKGKPKETVHFHSARRLFAHTRMTRTPDRRETSDVVIVHLELGVVVAARLARVVDAARRDRRAAEDHQAGERSSRWRRGPAAACTRWRGTPRTLASDSGVCLFLSSQSTLAPISVAPKHSSTSRTLQYQLRHLLHLAVEGVLEEQIHLLAGLALRHFSFFFRSCSGRNGRRPPPR